MTAQLLEFIAHHPLLVGTFVALLLALIFLESSKGAASVTSAELTLMLNQQKAVVVDIRKESEFKLGHIVHAINIPRESIKNQLDKLKKYPNHSIVLVDALGQHTSHAAAQLKDQGVGPLLRLRGGISQWQADGLPLVQSSGKSKK